MEHMTTMKPIELSGAALDWAVAKAEGTLWLWEDLSKPCLGTAYSTDMELGSSIIEREHIEFKYRDYVVAEILYRDGIGSDEILHRGVGKTMLEAAMRCFVASKFGDTLEIPTELL
jgi:hypothetical protein